MCSSHKDHTPLRHMCGVVLDGLEHVLAHEEPMDVILTTSPHLLTVLAMLVNLDPKLDPVR